MLRPPSGGGGPGGGYVNRAARLSTVFAACALLVSILASPAQAASATSSAGATRPANYGTARRAGPHAMPLIRPGARNTAAPAGAHLNYYGGPVLTHMNSIDVSYGGGTFISSGHPGASTIPSFTGQYLASGVMDCLSEYDTNISGGTNQFIGRGAFGGAITITPAT